MSLTLTIVVKLVLERCPGGYQDVIIVPKKEAKQNKTKRNKTKQKQNNKSHSKIFKEP